MPDDLPAPEKEEFLHQRTDRRAPWVLRPWEATVVIFLFAFIIALYGTVIRGRERHGWARQVQASNNCRQIIISLKSYAGDHGGKYPDGATANDVFRQLIKEGLLEDERIFSAPASPYLGDNNVGTAPDYAEALEPGENHWAMTRGLKDDSPGDCPLVFENPAQATWPPRWDGEHAGQAYPGRAWKGDKIIVGNNDGSVTVGKLIRDGNPLLTLQPIMDGKNLFELAGPHEVLDVAR